MTKIQINGREVEADPDQPLIRACHEAGVDVPAYCYHPGLTPVGSCRICQVEVRQGDAPPRVVVACRTPVAEGMVVDTEAPRAHEMRRECLEFLLKNHPLDCPICDKAGECDLQDYAFAEGQGIGRTNEPRRRLEKRKDLGDVILLDQERCVLCSRCVRFMEEVPKSPQLAVVGLGSRSTIDTFMGRPLEGNYQGNLADICPVGALTLKEFRFQARVWNLTKTPSTCGECSRGCATTVEVLRKQDVKRVRPRYEPAVNGWWMCDTGRFAFEAQNGLERIDGGLVRRPGGLRHASADEATAEAVEKLRGAGTRTLLASAWTTTEEGVALLALAESTGARAAFLSPAPNGLADDLLHTGDPAPNRRGLEQLGLEPLGRDAALELVRRSSFSWLVGERIVEGLGADALAEQPAANGLAVFDLSPLDAPAVQAFVSVPSCVERAGTWLNVDGHEGRIAAARPTLPDVRPLTDLLERAGSAPAGAAR